MTQTTIDSGASGHERGAGRGVGGDARSLDLEGLAAKSVEELGKLYARAAGPESVDALEGNPRGRMLAVRALDAGRTGRALAGIARATWFPWGGKSFSGTGRAGRGINRVHLGGRHALFPFLTSVKPSVIDGAPCIALDYDLPDNPGFIRAIHDEVREVAPGLYLGPAMWKSADGPAFVLWFALDTRAQAEPLGTKRS
jgi:hypothetical protein